MEITRADLLRLDLDSDQRGPEGTLILVGGSAAAAPQPPLQQRWIGCNNSACTSTATAFTAADDIQTLLLAAKGGWLRQAVRAECVAQQLSARGSCDVDAHGDLNLARAPGSPLSGSQGGATEHSRKHRLGAASHCVWIQ